MNEFNLASAKWRHAGSSNLTSLFQCTQHTTTSTTKQELCEECMRIRISATLNFVV